MSHTLVSKEGIRKQSMTVLIAILSLMQKYINPTTRSELQLQEKRMWMLTTPCSKHRCHYAGTSLNSIAVLDTLPIRICNAREGHLLNSKNCWISHASVNGSPQGQCLGEDMPSSLGSQRCAGKQRRGEAPSQWGLRRVRAATP